MAQPLDAVLWPIVEYTLEKALPVFPRLHGLDVADAVNFL